MKILSQRDPEWSEVKIGKSKETLGNKGCLITCISSITAEIGQYKDPKWLAENLDFTKDALLIWSSLTKAGLDFVYRFRSRNDQKIKEAFKDPDQFVVLQVNGNHWVWLVGMAKGYRVMDPYYGDVIYLSKRNYKITGFAIVERQDEDELTNNDEPNQENTSNEKTTYDFLSLKKGDKFVDLSHWNDIIDLSKTKSAGYKGAIHKCTQGTSNKDNAYIVNKKRIRDIEWGFGAYHFADATDYNKEVEWFLKNTGEIRKGDILMLDYETYVRDDADDWCVNWLKIIRGKTGIDPILYTGHGLLLKYKFEKVAKAGFKLIASRYGLQEQEPNENYMPYIGAFDKMWAWQYTSQGKVPGINKRVDLNIVC